MHLFVHSFKTTSILFSQESILTKPQDQANLISSLKRSHLIDSSQALLSSHDIWTSATEPALSFTHAQSPLDADTIALKLFSDDDVENPQIGNKEKVKKTRSFVEIVFMRNVYEYLKIPSIYM
jgi:hypothetical protein